MQNGDAILFSLQPPPHLHFMFFAMDIHRDRLDDRGSIPFRRGVNEQNILYIGRNTYLSLINLLHDLAQPCHYQGVSGSKGKGKVHACTGTEALYRPYGP